MCGLRPVLSLLGANHPGVTSEESLSWTGVFTVNMLSEALQSCGVSLALTAGRICRHAGEPLAEVARCGFIVLKRVVLKATSACLLPWETVWYGD